MSLIFRILLVSVAWVAAAAGAYAESESGDFLSGRFAKEHGDEATAIQYLQQALAQDQKNVAISGQLLVLSLQDGDMQAAVSRAKSMEAASDHEPLADLVLAVDAMERDDLDGAQSRFKKVFSFSPHALWPPLFNAWIEQARGALKKPLKVADVLPQGQSVPAFLAYQVALLNDAAGFTEVAGQQYDMAIADHARAPFRAVEAAADFYRRQGELKKLALVKKEYALAHPEASAIAGGDAAQLAALMGGKPASGEPLVANAHEGVAEVLFTMASVLYSADATQDTQLYLRLALYLKPDFPLAQLLLGNVLEDEEQFAAAADVYEAVNPDSLFYVRAVLRRAVMLQKQGKLDEAIALLDDYAGENTHDYEAYVAKGDLLREQSRFDDAAKAYSQAIERVARPGPQQWGMFFARGVCFERLNQWDKAEADLRKALALSPEQPEVLNYLGYSLLVRNQNFTEARKMVEQAYALSPNAPYIIDSLGWALYKSGDAKGALARFEEAIEEMPGDATVNEHLGDAYWQVGRKAEARFQWERALSFSPEPEQEKALREKLKDGLAPLAAPSVAQKPHEKGANVSAQRVPSKVAD